MKRLILLIVVSLMLTMATGCANFKEVKKNTTTTTTIKTIKEKGKPDVIIKIIVVLVEDVITINTGFSIGTQGLGTYYFSFVRDLSFM